MSENQEHEWLEGVAGRAQGDSSAVREGIALRRAVLDHEARMPVEQPQAQDPARERQLLARAREQGLGGERRGLFGAWPSWNLATVAATLAGVALVLALVMQVMRTAEEPSQDVVRDSRDQVVRLVADDPVRLKQEIVADLRAAGVEATGYEMLGRQGVDADLPRPLTDAVRAVLKKHRIPEPADSVLRVEIAPRSLP